MSIQRQVIIPPMNPPAIWVVALCIWVVLCLGGAAYLEYVDRVNGIGPSQSRLQLIIERMERDAAVGHMTSELRRVMATQRADGLRVVGAGTWQDPLRIVHDM